LTQTNGEPYGVIWSTGYPLLRIRIDGVPMRLVERNANLLIDNHHHSSGISSVII